MKVLFLVRSDFFSTQGGVYIQINKTVENLTSLGIECLITNSLKKVNINSYDIIHLTDLTWVYDNIKYLRHIKSKFTGKIVLSTIYWSFDDYAKNGSPFIQRFVYHLFGINGFESYRECHKYVTLKLDNVTYEQYTQAI